MSSQKTLLCGVSGVQYKHCLTIIFLLICLTPVLGQEAVFESYMQSGRVAFEKGNYVEAERFYKLAIKEVGLAVSEIGNTNTVGATVVEQLIDALNALSSAYYAQRYYEDAERVIRAEILLLEQASLENDSDYSVALNNLGLVLSSQQKFTEAEATHRKALKLREKNEGENHPNVAVSLLNLGKVYLDQNKYSEAEAMFSRSLQILAMPSLARTPEHVEAVVGLCNNLALIYKEQNKYAKAEVMYKLAIETTEQIKGRAHPDLIRYLTNYAGLLRLMKRPIEAARLEARSKRIEANAKRRD